MKRNPIGRTFAWLLGLGAAAAVGIAALVVVEEKKSSKPANQTPDWTRAAINPQIGAFWLPNNATFAISIPSSDANAVSLGAALAQLEAAGSIGSLNGWAPGQVPLAGYPNDNLGSNAYRATGVVNPQPAGGMPFGADQSTQVFLFTGVGPG